MKITEFRKLIREEIKSVISEVSTLGVSGVRAYAKKHNYSVKSKSSGGRVPLMYLSKDGKTYGPFDPTILTLDYLQKRLSQ